MKKLIASLAVTTLVACGTAPMTRDQIDSADYGQLMTPQQCTEAAEQFIRSTLKDPGSAQFTSSGPCTKGYMRDSLISGGKTRFGYLQTGTINAKNSYGGYVGFRQYRAVVKDSIVSTYCIVDKDGICM